MEGTWDLSGLYSSWKDPSIAKDTIRAAGLARRLNAHPGRCGLYSRFSAVAEKLDSYAYLLASVNLDNQQLLDFSTRLQEYITALRQGIHTAGTSDAAPGRTETGGPAVCREYDTLVSRGNLRPGYTKQLYHADEKVRREAYSRLEEGWRSIGETAAALYNRHLSGFGSLETAREKAAAESGFSRKEIDAFISDAEGNSELPGNFYRKKARFLEKEQIDAWDIFAPLLQGREVPWEQAKVYAVETAGRLGRKAEDVSRTFFQNPWIDYSIRPEKRGGAFTHPTVASHHPYIFLNYSGSLRDTLTLIHELFHAVHFTFAGRQMRNGKQPAVIRSEAVSAIGELMSLEILEEPEAAALVEEVLMLKIFRQIRLFRWEEKAAACYQKKGHCSLEDLSSLWLDTNRQYFGSSFTVPDSYRGFWIYVPHFFHFPLYGINYALGTAAGLAFIKRIKTNPGRAGRLFRKRLCASDKVPFSEWMGGLDAGEWVSQMQSLVNFT